MRRVFFGLLPFLISLSHAQTICIDPGHPSENGVGSRGKKLTEVRAAWTVAKRLEILLRADGYRVVLTKASENEKVTNRRRAEIANSIQADLFLRLHCDAASGSGISVYYPDQTGRVGGFEGPAETVRKASRRLGQKFHPALVAALKGWHPDRGLLTDRQTAIGKRQGALTGSIYAKVPVLLIEMAVLTNPRDEKFLSSKEGHEALCRALRRGVRAACPLADLRP